MPPIAWPVTTARLSLRPATAADAEAVWAFRRLPEVGRWMTRAPETFEAFEAVFVEADYLARTVVIELDGEVVGDLMLSIQTPWAQAEVADQVDGVEAELGWVLHPDHHGHGYATEAVAELVRVCFEDLGLRRVTAECFEANEASWRLMERLGMRREAHSVRSGLHRSGDWLDGLAYALLADEWCAAHPD